MQKSKLMLSAVLAIVLSSTAYAGDNKGQPSSTNFGTVNSPTATATGGNALGGAGGQGGSASTGAIKNDNTNLNSNTNLVNAGASAGATSGSFSGASNSTDVKNDVKNTNTSNASNTAVNTAVTGPSTSSAVSNAQGGQGGSATSSSGGNTQTNAGNNSQVTTGATTQSNAGNNSTNESKGNTTTVDASDNSTTIYEQKDQRVASTAYATTLVASNGTCFGSASGGVQGLGFGVSLGSTKIDEGCNARYDAQAFAALGLREVALARLCQQPQNAEAMEKAGFSCTTGKAVTKAVAVIPMIDADAVAVATPVKLD